MKKIIILSLFLFTACNVKSAFLSRATLVNSVVKNNFNRLNPCIKRSFMNFSKEKSTKEAPDTLAHSFKLLSTTLTVMLNGIVFNITYGGALILKHQRELLEKDLEKIKKSTF
jgi:hypothetical protein